MTELSFVGYAPAIGKVPVELHIDIADYRGMTTHEIARSLRGALRTVSRIARVEIEVEESEVVVAAAQVAAMANLQQGEVELPPGVPEYVFEDWT